MLSETIQVRMLGGFSIEWNGQTIDDHSNRMRKIWLLLAYLIYNRNSHISQDNYITLLRGRGDGEAVDPNSNLKALFFRARTMLNQLHDTAGHDWIVRKNGSYAWNTEVPLRLDIEDFDRFCRGGDVAEDETLRLNLYQQALALYHGDFLPKLSTENWVLPIATYYHRVYLETVEKTLAILEQRELWNEASALCQKALQVEPYSEALYQHTMRSKLAVGDRAGVLSIYENMSELLFSTFGIMPSEESLVIYREAIRAMDQKSVPVGTLRELLRESDTAKGALFCEYNFFKVLYQAQARAIARSGDAIHIALFSIHGQRKKELSPRSLETAMENLKRQVVDNLRQGDVVTQCSMSQLIVMLPQANYENSCAVCDRLVRAFFRQYPHSPIDIHFSVHPLEPTQANTDRSASQV